MQKGGLLDGQPLHGADLSEPRHVRDAEGSSGPIQLASSSLRMMPRTEPSGFRAATQRSLPRFLPSGGPAGAVLGRHGAERLGIAAWILGMGVAHGQLTEPKVAIRYIEIAPTEEKG